MMRSPDPAQPSEPAGEIDLRAIGAALKRRGRTIFTATALAFVLVTVFVNVVTPRYTSETQVLLENQETFFTRPDRVSLPQEQISQLDQEAVASHVQLINSRDIARRAIKQLGLEGNPEFDPLAGGLNPFKAIMILLGLSPDPTGESADARIVTQFLDKLTIYSPPKTRVIAIQFTSRDPDLAARAANTVAQLYLQEQSAAKRTSARLSADALSAQVADLRIKLAAADDEREAYRLKSGLLAGSNNMTLSGQQLADINTELSKARSVQAEAQAKSSMIRELIRTGKAADVSEVINNDIVRRVSDQRVTAQAQLAREARTLMPGHPRIKELTAQLAEFDLALKVAAKQAAVTLENEAKIAGQRVANLETVLSQQKKDAGVANTDEVHLRALERVTQSYKDQLESSAAKYQEALARQASTATPADARVISTAARPQEPSFPKKIPFIIFGTIATFVFAVGFVVAAELLSGRVDVEPEVRRVAERSAPLEKTASGERAIKPRRAWSFPEEEPEDVRAQDPVFAPVAPRPEPSRPAPRPSFENARMLATGGMLAATLDYLKAFGRSAAASRSEHGDMPAPRAEKPKPAAVGFGWDTYDTTQLMVSPSAAASSIVTSSVAEAAVKADVSALAQKIIDAHVPGRGLHIVGTGFASEAPGGPDGGSDVLISLGRALSNKGRAIIVDLNRTPAGLTILAGTDDNGGTKIATMQGLAELLSGDSTFAEVIHRDQGSRLHYIPTGLQEADFRDFDLILDALSETYDFIVMLTPAFPQSEIAKIMAPYADFVVLAATTGETATADLESELLKAGAREVLVAGTARVGRQDVA